MPSRITESEYNAAFPSVPAGKEREESPRRVALENALDIRKFEIQLYWTRAAYFWTFTAAALGAYGGVQTIDEDAKRLELSVLVCSIGLVFAFAWYFANRGSKQWQENWEKHVDLLETDINGPLYKVVLRRPSPTTLRARAERMLSGPGPYSVSKINQIVSVYICTIWVMLLTFALVQATSGPSQLSLSKYLIPIILTSGAVLLMWRSGRTEANDSATVATIRTRIFEDPERSEPTRKQSDGSL